MYSFFSSVEIESSSIFIHETKDVKLKVDILLFPDSKISNNRVMVG
jgi:hypothetical protein